VGPVTGAALNPARTLGPLVTAALWGGTADWSQLPVYLLAQILGGLLAGRTYVVVSRLRTVPA
jgi:glycerol uptake facilitator protein